MSKARLKVAINAQVSPGGVSGGIEQAVLGLIWALGRVEDDGTECVIVTRPEAPDWVQGFLGSGQRVVVRSYPSKSRAEEVARLMKRALQPARRVLLPTWVWLRGRRALGDALIPAAMDGFFESLGVDVVHCLLIAVNKMDLVGYTESLFDEIVREYRQFAARLGIVDLKFIPISALRGDNVVERSRNMPWYRAEPILDYLENVYIGSTGISWIFGFRSSSRSGPKATSAGMPARSRPARSGREMR
jgi:hypothetical protein